MPALPQLYPYKAGPIEPVVLPGETVGIWVNKWFTFYEVQYIEGIPRSDPLEFDFGALLAQTVGAVTPLPLIEMPDDEFAQWRCAVIDDISMILYQGRADQRHKARNRVGTYTKFTDLFDPDGHTGEFFVFNDESAFGQPTNQTDYPITTARVVFWGFRYVLSQLTQFDWPKKVPATWTRIPATAHL
jgi:hypothetical protein